VGYDWFFARGLSILCFGVPGGSSSTLLVNCCTSHRAQVPYGQFAVASGASIDAWRGMSLSTSALSGMRSLCRLRCGELRLRHLNGQESVAKFQRCIFCDARVRNATVHCLALCSKWEKFREDLSLALAIKAEQSYQEFALICLRADCPAAAEVMLRWAQEVDRECYIFWKKG
jgi:hypothetical protein